MMHPLRATLFLAGSTAVGCLALSTAMASISGSSHDFSDDGWSEFEICKPCHTPHDADTSALAPLWNHELPTGTSYVVYDSPWLHEEAEQPGPASRLCLSCHDGTIALDSFGGATGDVFIGEDGLIGTDLSDDHPIGIPWTHQYSDLNCANCHNPYDPDWERALPFFDAKVECLTCHDPHNGGSAPSEPGMLRLTLSGSQLCFHCHSL